MDFDQVELTLLPAPDDPVPVCYETAAKLVQIQENLRKRCVDVTSVIADRTGDGSHMGQFVMALSPSAVAAIAAIAEAWVRTRLGRRTRFKFADVEAEVRTVREIDGLLKRLTASLGQQASASAHASFETVAAVTLVPSSLL
jgi:hypothetical protein